MSPARTLVDLSRQFYRARRYNSNSILRPLAVCRPKLFSRLTGVCLTVKGWWKWCEGNSGLFSNECGRAEPTACGPQGAPAKVVKKR